MPHEDQREFYTCPICGITTGNDIDGNEKHDCPEEEDYIKINLSLLTNKPMKESTVPIDEKWKEEHQLLDTHTENETKAHKPNTCACPCHNVQSRLYSL